MNSATEEPSPPSAVAQGLKETVGATEDETLETENQQQEQGESTEQMVSSPPMGWDKEILVLTLVISVVALAAFVFAWFNGDVRIMITGLWDPHPPFKASGSQTLRMAPPPSEAEALGLPRLSRPMRTWQGETQDGGSAMSEQQLLPSLFSGQPLPFVVLHGIGDQCSNPGLSRFVDILNRQVPGANGLCLSIGNGAADSWTMPLKQQVQLVCDSIKKLPQLKNGFNIVGLSQGNLIGRGYLEWCSNGPPVHTFISFGGPHAGTAAVPLCTNLYFCRILDLLIQLGIYSRLVQNHIAPTGYVKIPSDLQGYLRGCTFLPFLNNEHEDARNLTYARQMTSLNRLVLIMFEEDRVIIPKETAWFGWYNPEDRMETVVPASETRLYKEDWVGLRELDEAGRVDFVSIPGDHLEISAAAIRDHVVPYLRNNSASSSF